MSKFFNVGRGGRWWLAGAMLLCVAVVSDRYASHSAAHAEVRKPTTRQAFLSGSERSEQVLREISQTLKSIDARLARIEKLAAMPQP